MVPLGEEGLKRLQRAIRELYPKERYVSIDVDAHTVRYSDELIVHEDIRAYTGEEEPARAFVVTWLCTRGGYLPSNVELEKRHSVGRPKVGAKIDVLVKRPDGTTYALIEVKAPEEYDIGRDAYIEGQLFNVAPLEPGSSILAYVTTEVRADGTVNVRGQTVAYTPALTFAAWRNSGYAHSVNLPVNYGEAVHVPLIKGGDRDLRHGLRQQELERYRKRMHDILWRGTRPDNLVYEYVVKLFLAKIFDEKSTNQG
jgi:type I restriction enzyme M protein